jgi:hypothetical protein
VATLQGLFSTCAVTRPRFSSGSKARPAIAAAGSSRGRLEVTKCLKPHPQPTSKLGYHMSDFDH